MTHAAGRADYDQTFKAATIPGDEPVFVIRARDAVSAKAVRAWAVLATEAGAPAAVIEQALQQADRMEAWATKKVADADHLTPQEQQQLSYQLERRMWGGGDGPAARSELGDVFLSFLREERAQIRHPLFTLDDLGAG